MGTLSCILFSIVIVLMGFMIFSAINENHNSKSRSSLLFIYVCTLVIWSLFPLTWMLSKLYPGMTYHIEVLNLFTNFTSKVRRRGRPEGRAEGGG